MLIINIAKLIAITFIFSVIRLVAFAFIIAIIATVAGRQGDCWILLILEVFRGSLLVLHVTGMGV